MWLYLLGRHFSFQPNTPNLTPAHPILYRAIAVSICEPYIYLLPRFYMLTFSLIYHLSSSFHLIKVINKASSVPKSNTDHKPLC